MRTPRKGSAAEPLPPLRWPAPLVGEDLLAVADLNTDEVGFLLDLAARVKAQPARYRHALQDKTLAMLFEKPSLRTRVTFQLAMEQLGGRALYLGPEEIGLGKREAFKDVARNLSTWVDVIMARVFSHETVFHLAEHARVPVINGLSDLEHPCQALGDYMTLLEHRRHPSLDVASAAAIQPAISDERLPGVDRHAVDGNGVLMRLEDQRSVRIAIEPCDNVFSQRSDILALILNP